MHIASIISLIILTACFAMWFFASIKNLKFNKNIFIALTSAILMSICTFAYFFEPVGGDLSRHYELLEQMKMGGWNFASNKSQYSSLFIYNIFAYLIAQSGNYALLQTIPLIIDFVIFIHIYFDVTKRNNVDSSSISAKDSFFVFFLWITSFGLKLAITGIRCVLAVALCAWALYNEYICKRKKGLSIAMYIVALFIHNFALWIIAIRLAMLVKKKGVVVSILLIVILFGHMIVQFLYDIVPNRYLQFIFARILETFSEFQLGGENLENSGSAILMTWAGFVLLAIYLLYMSNFVKKHYQYENAFNKSEKVYTDALFDACYTIGLMGLPMAFNYLYMERYMYLIAWAFLMISYYYLKTVRICLPQKKKNFEIMTGMTFVCLFVLFFNDIYILMVNYVGYYFLAM